MGIALFFCRGDTFINELFSYSYAELVKIYLKSEHRGKGIGKQLIDKSIASAKEQGYTHLYLESFPSLKEAIVLYEKIGFKRIEKPLGDSGHFACDVWMVFPV